MRLCARYLYIILYCVYSTQGIENMQRMHMGTLDAYYQYIHMQTTFLNKMPISKTCYYSRSMTLKLKMPHLNLVNVTTHNIQTANWNWNSNHESLIHFTRIVAHDSKILTSCTLAHCKLIYSRSGFYVIEVRFNNLSVKLDLLIR